MYLVIPVADRITFRLCVYRLRLHAYMAWRHRTCPNCEGLLWSLKDIVVCGLGVLRRSMAVWMAKYCQDKSF